MPGEVFRIQLFAIPYPFVLSQTPRGYARHPILHATLALRRRSTRRYEVYSRRS